RKLVRILKNNLRPEIRHELLNVDISSVSELRETCRRREAFLDDVKHAHGYSKVTPFKREVSELIQESDSLERSKSEGELEVDAFSLVCWNCRKEGHRYQDCLSEKHPRPFLPIRLFDRTVYGLLDSGASKSCIGGDLAEEVMSNNTSYKPINVKAKTADGRSQQVIGKMKIDSRSSERIKRFWQKVRNCRLGVKYICSLPLGPIRLFDRTVYGLLDSGASISCIGGDLAEEVMSNNTSYKPINVKAKTADGRSQQVIGKMKIDVEYGKEK
ncbi:hypothetical protein KR026_010750, partial [Drosophila bipectinata]